MIGRPWILNETPAKQGWEAFPRQRTPIGWAMASPASFGNPCSAAVGGVGWTVTVILGLNSDPKFQSGSQLPKFYGAGQDLQAAPGPCCSFLSIEDWTRNSLISLRLHYLWWEPFEDKIKEILGLFGSYWSPSSGWGLVTLTSVGGSCLLLPREGLSSLYLVHTHTHTYTHIY